MEERNKIIDEIFTILIGILFLASGVLIGAPLFNNTKIIFAISPILFFVFFVLKKRLTKNYHCIQDKMDYFVILLWISSFLPLVFKSYATYSGTVEYCCRYFSLLCFYFMIKEIAKQQKNRIWLFQFLIASGMIVFLFGLDNLTGNKLQILTPWIKSNSFQNPDLRMIGGFGYANSLAAFFVVISFLSLGMYLMQKKEQRVQRFLYAGAFFIALTAILLSYSRLVWVFFAITLLLYFIANKKKRGDILRIGILEGVFCLIYFFFYNKWSLSQENLWIWIGMIIFTCLTASIAIFLPKKEKIGWITIFSAIVILVGIGITFFIGITKITGLVLFTNEKAKNTYSQFIYEIEPSKEYHLHFTIDSKVKFKNIEPYTIVIEEKNEQNDTLQTTEIQLGEFTGIKEMVIQTTAQTNKFYLSFKTTKPLANGKLNIQKLTVNGKEIVLNYVFLPKSLVDKIVNTGADTKSGWERKTLIKNGLTLGFQNWMLGTGGDSWRYLQFSVQDYAYSILEVHSYPIEIFIEFGILGIISCVGIVVCLLVTLIKKIKKGKMDSSITMAIIIAIVFCFLHSCVDFDLSFMHMQMVLISLMAIFMAVPSKDTKQSNKKDIIFILICLFIYLLGLKYQLYDRIQDEKNATIQEIKEQMIKEPYVQIIRKAEKMSEKIEEEITEENLESQTMHLKFIYECIEKSIKNKPLWIQENLISTESIKQIAKTTERIGKQFSNERILQLKLKYDGLVMQNLADLEDNLKEYEKFRITQEEAHFYQKRIEELKEESR